MNRREFLSLMGIGFAASGCGGNMNLDLSLDDWKKLSKEDRFENLYQDGYSFKFEMRQRGAQSVTVSTKNIGDLVVTSGKIIVCDPLMGPDLRYHLTKQVSAGSYPVVLSFADIKPFGDFRVAAARIVFSSERTVRWEIAEINELKLRPGGDYNYGVDSGTGSFIDYDAAKVIARLSFEDFESRYCDEVIAAMVKNETGKYRAAGWANIPVSEETMANLIAFHSGWGDGGYISYWGYDQTGSVTGLLTDFDLFYTENN